MSHRHLRRLCRPNILRAIDSCYLNQFLAPHAPYLASRGVTLPLEGREAPLKYLALAQLLLAPDDAMPAELLDALYLIDELATPPRIETLLSMAREGGIRWDSHLDLTPAEVVLQLWLLDRRLVEKLRAEAAAERFRAFDYYQPDAPGPPKIPADLPGCLTALETELTHCFRQHGYSGYVHVHLSEEDDSIWFYIGHGTRVRREAAVKDEVPTSVCYRPEVYDAVVFVRLTGELGIHADGSWEKQIYQGVFGKHLFGDQRLFAGTAKYTLDPLRLDGEAALRCQDVPEIEWVRLGELRVFEPGRMPRSVTHRSRDLFASWQSPRLPVSPNGHLVGAGFHVKLLGCRNSRWLAIRPANHAQYARDVDRTWIEAWLRRRGFIGQQSEGDHARPDAVLAVA